MLVEVTGQCSGDGCVDLGALHVLRLMAALALPPPPPARAAFSDIWLRDRLLMLCHLSVAPLMCGGLSHLAGMQAAMAGLRAMGRWGLNGLCWGSSATMCFSLRWLPRSRCLAWLPAWL